MRTKTIETFINRCQEVIDLKLTRNAYLVRNSLPVNYFYCTFQNILKAFDEGKLSTEHFNAAVEIMTKLDSSYAMYSTKGDGKENYTNIDRDEEGRIVSYSFKINRKNRGPIVGKLTRDDMEIICRLYTYYGQSLTKREISRYFPDWSLEDFKKILNAWNIYKDSSPLPLHIIEEHSTEELLDIQARNKENDFIKKAEQSRIKATEKLLNKIQQENYELKQKLNNGINVFNDLISKDYTNTYPETIIPDNNYTGIVVLSDMHIGAYNEKLGYVPLETYNETEINRRLNKVVDFIYTTGWSNLIVVNLGDSVDSYNKQTTRGGHELPCIISNKEMSEMYIRCMMTFFNSIKDDFNTIQYYCVGESNHDGDFGWINNILLAEKLTAIGIESHISSTPADNFDVGNITFTYLHGKDNNNQFKNHPLTLNDKTINWFNNYYADNGYNFKSKKVVLKGDLHQYAVTKASNFTYISAPSMYGSSQWISANFGKTKWGVLYLEIDGHDHYSCGVIED